MLQGREQDRTTYEKVLGQGSYGIVEKHGDEARKYIIGRPSEGISSFALNEMLATRLLETHSLSYPVQGNYLIKDNNVEFTLGMPVFGMPLDQWANVTSFTIRARWVEKNLHLLCRFLDRMHNLGIMHGDIRGDNILLSGDNAVFIDFGSSRINMRGGMGYMHAAGAYAAPEYISSRIVNVEVDYWALGATIYYVLCKVNPYTTSDLADHMACDIPSLVQSGNYYAGLDQIMVSSIFSETTRNIMRRCYSYDRRRRITPHVPAVDLDESDINRRLLPSDVMYVNKELGDEEYYALVASLSPSRLALDIWDRYLSCHKTNEYEMSLLVCISLAQKIQTYKGTVLTKAQIVEEKKILECLQYLLVHRRGSRQHKWFQLQLPPDHRGVEY